MVIFSYPFTNDRMKNHDVIRAYQALSPEFYEFRDAILDSSGFMQPDGITNLLENTPAPQTPRPVELAEVPFAVPAIEVVPMSIVQSWFGNADTRKAQDYNTERNVPLRSPCCSSLAYDFVILFCESIITLGPVVACLEWILNQSTTSYGQILPRDKVQFLHKIATSVGERMAKDSNLRMHDVLEIFLNRWDFLSTQICYGKNFAEKSVKLDKYSLSTTFTNRLFGAWYNRVENTTGSESDNENLQRMRVLKISPRGKDLGTCLKYLFLSDSKRETKKSKKDGIRVVSLPEILLVVVGDNRDGHENTVNKRDNCIGFPLKIIFSSESNSSSEASRYCYESFREICLQVPKSTAIQVQYNIHSIGFFDVANEMNLCMAYRSYSPDRNQEHGVWNKMSYDKVKRIRMHLSSMETLQTKPLLFACYMKRYNDHKEELTKVDYEDRVASPAGLDMMEIGNAECSDHEELPFHDDLKVSPPGLQSDYHAQNNAYIKLAEKTDDIRPLLKNEISVEKNLLPPETTLGEPLWDEQWNEALDKGKLKKTSRKREFPKGNPFQKFMNSHQLVKERDKLPNREKIRKYKK